MSDISFSKLTWENLPARTTALSATNLNRIENGINDSVNGVNANSHSIAELQTRISQMSGGVPTVVDSISDMTDTGLIYILSSDSNWYYYNSSAWTSGGTYGGAVTSTTFNQHGVPADDFAVGDALAEKADAADLTAVQIAVAEKADSADVTAIDERVTAVEDSTKGLYAETNDVSFWEVGGLGSAGEDSNPRTTSIRTKSYLPVSNYKKIVTGSSFTTGYLVLYTGAFERVVRMAISGSAEYAVSSLLETYPTAEYIRIEIGEVGGDISCYNYISLLSDVSGIYGDVTKKQNTTCNNLIGSVFGKLYPVEDVTEGTVLTISTSDGQNLGGGVRIGFYDEDRQYLGYVTAPVNAAKRTITVSAQLTNTAYIATTNDEPRVPLMLNYGSTALPYEEYFDDVPELTEKVLDLADTVSGINVDGKQNATCNNLVGSVFKKLYPVEGITEGTVLTMSTSDGEVIGGTKAPQLWFYDENREYLGYFNFHTTSSKRTVTVSETLNGAKYITIGNAEPRVPLMVNIGSTALPYEEYFEDAPTVTETLLDVVENVEELNDTVGGVVEVKDLLSQSKYVYAATDSGVGTEKVLTLMHITDMHGNRDGMDYALSIYNRYSTSIDDIIHTGDTVVANLSNGITEWINSGCAEKVLNVIGNHDTEENLVLQAAGKDNVYNTIFAPYISGWNVTQPTGVDDSESDDYHALYYYKDYAEAKVRLIVCDTNFWDDAQKTWLTGALAGAKTLDYAVVLACHNVKKLTELTTANFSSYNGDGINEGNSCANQPDNWLDPVKDFMDDGGHFVCILAGHNHNGHMGYMTYYPDVFVYVAQKSSMNRVSGTARILGESNQNTVSIVTINPKEKLFKLFAIGAQVDGHLRQRHIFCYNYETKTIISQW